MKRFKGIQKTFTYEQLNHGPIDQVFPLLCPVREKDWLDGWDYQMVHSNSGLIEKDCVFTTPHHGQFDTVWQVTQHDNETNTIEFVRVTPLENIARINIQLEKLDEYQTKALITYQHTALSEDQNAIIKNEMEQLFLASMQWWEKSINHYLKTGTKLMRV